MLPKWGTLLTYGRALVTRMFFLSSCGKLMKNEQKGFNVQTILFYLPLHSEHQSGKWQSEGLTWGAVCLQVKASPVTLYSMWEQLPPSPLLTPHAHFLQPEQIFKEQEVGYLYGEILECCHFSDSKFSVLEPNWPTYISNMLHVDVRERLLHRRFFALQESLKSFKWGEFKLCNRIALTGDLYVLLEMLYECFKTNISWSIQYLSRIAGAWLYLFALRDGLPLQECLHALQAFSLQHFLGSRLDALQLSPALKPSLYRIPFTFKIKAFCYCSRTWHIWDEVKLKDFL